MRDALADVARSAEKRLELSVGDIVVDSHVILRTPMSEELSGALECFDVDGMKPAEVVAALAKKNIVATTTPYRVSYARLTPGLLNSEEEIETTLRAVRELAG